MVRAGSVTLLATLEMSSKLNTVSPRSPASPHATEDRAELAAAAGEVALRTEVADAELVMLADADRTVTGAMLVIEVAAVSKVPETDEGCAVNVKLLQLVLSLGVANVTLGTETVPSTIVVVRVTCVLVDEVLKCALPYPEAELPYPEAELPYGEAVGKPYAPPVEMKTTGLIAASATIELSEREDNSLAISVWGGGKRSGEAVSGDVGMV